MLNALLVLGLIVAVLFGLYIKSVKKTATIEQIEKTEKAIIDDVQQKKIRDESNDRKPDFYQRMRAKYGKK